MQNDPTTSVEMIEFLGLVEPSDGREVLMPSPPLPIGYEPISAAQALAADLTGYWACLAFQQQYGRYGLLIYWQHNNRHSFYPTEDACQLLRHYGAAWGFDLLGYYSAEEPSQDQLDINGLWWNKHGVFAQHCDEEVPHAME